MNEKDWLGIENQLAIDIWNKKYKFEDETFEEWLERISNGNQELKQLIIEIRTIGGKYELYNFK